MSTQPAIPDLPSIYQLEPLDIGGIEARDGFAFQDHIAAGFCLDLLVNASLQEVWCETHDDITLVWLPSPITVEFVQVKGASLDQLWTVAKLCERESKANGQGHCILEKSLMQDRCQETARFRIVTSRPVKTELEILTLPLDATGRNGDTGLKALTSLNESIRPRVGEFRSPKGNDFQFWTASTYWQVRHAEKSVQDANILTLATLLEARGVFLAADQLLEVYTKLLKLVWDAARADPRINISSKRITKKSFEHWLIATTTTIAAPTEGSSSLLRQKLERAQLPEDVIASALEQKRYYRQEVLNPKYMRLDDRPLVEAEVCAALQHLRSQLDNSSITDDGIAFHALCLDRLATLREQLPSKPKPPFAFLQGCMYSITGRCLHRFKRVSA